MIHGSFESLSHLETCCRLCRVREHYTPSTTRRRKIFLLSNFSAEKFVRTNPFASHDIWFI
jgi:hypothetical protein